MDQNSLYKHLSQLAIDVVPYNVPSTTIQIHYNKIAAELHEQEFQQCNNVSFVSVPKYGDMAILSEISADKYDDIVGRERCKFIINLLDNIFKISICEIILLIIDYSTDAICTCDVSFNGNVHLQYDIFEFPFTGFPKNPIPMTLIQFTEVSVKLSNYSINHTEPNCKLLEKHIFLPPGDISSMLAVNGLKIPEYKLFTTVGFAIKHE